MAYFFRSYDIFTPVIIPLYEDGRSLQDVEIFLQFKLKYEKPLVEDILSWLKGRLNRVYLDTVEVNYSESPIPFGDVIQFVYVDTYPWDSLSS